MKWLVYATMIALVFASGCDDQDTTETTPDDQRAEAEAADDTFERSENWPDDLSRVVSMAPNTTELLFELGLGDRVVAVTRYCDWPEEVAELPTIGGMLDPDHEAILAAEPDVVVGAIDGADHEIIESFDRLGIDYGFVSMDDFDSVARGIERFGRWFDIDEAAEQFTDEFRHRLQEASQRHEHSQRSHRALLVLDRDPIYAAGPDSFGDELLKHAGLDNALEDDVDDYPMLDAEKILSLNPEVIVDVSVGDDEATVVAYWNNFEGLDAVDAGRVVHLDDPVMLRPGPRIPRAVDRLGEELESL